jgi:hypothetical protein
MLELAQWDAAKRWRDVDILHRGLENYRREVDNTRRAVSEKAEQLKGIG